MLFEYHEMRERKEDRCEAREKGRQMRSMREREITTIKIDDDGTEKND